MRRILSEALDAAAAELADLASAAQNLQLALEGDSEGAPPQAFGPAPSDSLRAPLEPGKQRKVVALQSLDYLTQSLQCLAGFIALAAAEIPPECELEPERLL
ncbi:MAG: hypothetical protein JOZ05_01860, partial [Acetobacteraceae bacterium]|nr:hypothetical protein [Acetobacteraceae bacterium]